VLLSSDAELYQSPYFLSVRVCLVNEALPILMCFLLRKCAFSMVKLVAFNFLVIIGENTVELLVKNASNIA